MFETEIKKRRLERRFFIFLAALIWAVPPCFSSEAPAAAPLRVAHVADGDTVRLTDGAEVRLIGIDTPEHDDERNLKNARRFGLDPASYALFAVKAHARAEELVRDADIRLEFDASNAATGHRDKYGRLLAYVWVGDMLLNARLIEEGLAPAYGRFPHRRRSEFYQLQKAAKAAKKGMWAFPAKRHPEARSAEGSRPEILRPLSAASE